MDFKRSLIKRKTSGEINVALDEIEEMGRANKAASAGRSKPPPPPPPPLSHRAPPRELLEQQRKPSRRSNRDVNSTMEAALAFAGEHNQSVIAANFDHFTGFVDTQMSTDEDEDGIVAIGTTQVNFDNSDRIRRDSSFNDSKTTFGEINSDYEECDSEAGKEQPKEVAPKTNRFVSEVNFSDNDSDNTDSKTDKKESGRDSNCNEEDKTINSPSIDGSISIEDIMVDTSNHREHESATSASGSMTNGLTVMEKLKLAAKLDSATENMFLKELLETSIQDLEVERRTKSSSSSNRKRHKKNSSSRRSTGSRTPSSLKSNRSSSRRHHSKKKSDRSRSSEGRGTRSSDRGGSERKLRKSVGDRSDANLSVMSGMSATSTTAAVPREVYRGIFSRVRGGEPLPREDAVGGIVRKLFAGNEENGHCVALVPSDENCTEGIGKTTLAGLVCSHQDVRSRYNKAIAWVDMKQKGGEDQAALPLDYDRYSAALHSILAQCGISSGRLTLSPYIKTQCEDSSLSNIRMKIQMKEAREAMGKILSSPRNFPRKRKGEDDKTSILIVLDDVLNEPDIEWFVFRSRGDKEVINDVLLTSSKEIKGVTSVPVPPWNEEDSIKLVLMEANLQSSHQISKSVEMKEIVKKCLYHPLTIKYVGRWLNLKRTTGNKGSDELLMEISSALNNAPSTSPVHVLYEVLGQAITPLVKGKRANTIRLCFASLHAFFSGDFCYPSIPLEVVNKFFSSVVKSKGEDLSEGGVLACPLYRSHGRHAAKLVPEILGALGIFNITKHSTKEKSIQIDHEVIHRFGDRVLKDEEMHRVVDEAALKNWHVMYTEEYIDQYNWKDVQPDRAQTYALQYMPRHMIEAEMFESAREILSDKAFVQGRISTFGLVEGTKTHLQDVETFYTKFITRDDRIDTVLRVCEIVESVLMKKLNSDAGKSARDSFVLDCARCLQMIGASLGKVCLLDDAAKYCDKCVELVYGDSSEVVGSLLFNTAILYLETKRFESAREIMDLVIGARSKMYGEQNVQYARSLCLLGDILFEESDYEGAESQYKKYINIIKANANNDHLDLAVGFFKIGMTDYERQYYDDAVKCFNQSSKFAEKGLDLNHEYFVIIYFQMGNALINNGSKSDATYAFEQALSRSKEVKNKSRHLVVRAHLIGGALRSIKGEHEKAIENYRGAINILEQYVTNDAKTKARVQSLIGTELVKMSNVESAIEIFRESIHLAKQHVGDEHLDVANALVTMSSLENLTGKFARAARHLEEAVGILKTRLGDSAKVAGHLTDLGSYFKDAGDNEKSIDAYTNALLILTGMKKQRQELVRALLGLADLLHKKGEYKVALGHYNDCLHIQKSLYTETHEDVATTLFLMGVVKMNQGQCGKSLGYLNEAVDVMTAINGEVCPFNGDAHNLMGIVETKNGNYEKAMERFSDALRVRRALGNRLQEAETLKNMGNLGREKNEYHLALELYEECLGIITEENGRDSESVAEVLVAMGNVASDMNMHDDAISHYKNALQKLLRHHDESHQSIASLLQKMGMIQFRAGKLQSALLYLEKSIETFRKLGGTAETNLIPALFVMGNIHNLLKHSQEAEEAWRDAFEVFGSVKDKAYLYPEIKVSLTELLDARRGQM